MHRPEVYHSIGFKNVDTHIANVPIKIRTLPSLQEVRSYLLGGNFPLQRQLLFSISLDCSVLDFNVNRSL